MAGKTCDDFLSPGINSLKSYLNVQSVATSRYSTVELDASTFSDSQMNLPIVMSSAEQKNKSTIKEMEPKQISNLVM